MVNHLEVGMRKKNESGFTLLEIALVILVAGLLIGAVLNSRGIQEAASSLRLQKQVEELKVAVDLYFDRMGVLPGSNEGNSSSSEWDEDLVNEQLVTSTRRANTHAFGGEVDFRINQTDTQQPFTDSSAENATVFRYTDVPAKWAKTLIDSLDDGTPDEGNIRVTENSGGQNAITSTDLNNAIGSSEKIRFFVRQ